MKKNKNAKNNVLGLLLMALNHFYPKKISFYLLQDSFVLYFRVSLTCSHAKDSPLKTFLKTFVLKNINSDGVFVY